MPIQKFHLQSEPNTARASHSATLLEMLSSVCHNVRESERNITENFLKEGLAAYPILFFRGQRHILTQPCAFSMASKYN